MPDLILVRHAAPEIEAGLPGHAWRLSAAGRAQCQPLAEQIRRFYPAMVFSSAEVKAQETAQLLAAHLGLAAQPVDGLHEHARSHYQWVDQDTFERDVRAFFDHPQALVMGDETADQALARFTTALDGLLARYPGQNLAVVSHGCVISLYVARARGIEAFPFWKGLGMPCAVVLSLPERVMISRCQ
jgi:broad specificity phosphatase PhoE